MVQIKECEMKEGLSGHPTHCGWIQIPPSGMCRESEVARMRDWIVITRIVELGMDHKAHGFSWNLQMNHGLIR